MTSRLSHDATHVPCGAPLAAVSGGLPMGGSTTFLLNLGIAFQRRGYALPILSLSSHNAHAGDFARAGQSAYCVQDAQLIYEDRLERGYTELSQHCPRAVLACLGTESFEMLRLVPRGVLRLGIVQSHEPNPYHAMQRYARYLDVAVGVSQEITRQLAAMPELRRARIECIPYGINFQTPPPERVPTTGNPIRIVYVGRLVEEQKRISRMAELIDHVRQAGLPVEFTLVGSGPEEAALRERFAGTSKVRFTGTMPNEQVRDLLVQQDLLLLLSDYEGLPLSLVEAMGQGVVPLVSDLPSGMRDVVTADCGFRVPVGDVASAQEIIAKVCREPERLHALAKKCMSKARGEYGADKMAEHYLGIISAGAIAPVQWPSRVKVPPPLGLSPWLYSGVVRRIRRRLKPWLR